MSQQYLFEVSFFGEGNTVEEAWNNAVEQFSLDPGTSYTPTLSHDGCSHGVELNKLVGYYDKLEIVESNGIFWRCMACGKVLHHSEISDEAYWLKDDPKLFDKDGNEITASFYEEPKNQIQK